MSKPSEDLTVDATLAGPERPARAPVVLGRGEVLSRYLILDELGSGGMGKVYAAYDPELDRKLAIKLLHHAPGTETSRASVSGSSRLQREAQAMAKLSHRNVVAVHDVGTHEGRVFVAMEFVDGGALDACCWVETAACAWLTSASPARPIRRSRRRAPRGSRGSPSSRPVPARCRCA